MKKRLIQYGVCGVIGALIAYWIMSSKGLFVPGHSMAEVFFILSDAFFVPGILIILFGALLWISTTGLFDSIGFAFSAAAHALLPFVRHEHKTFYDYKMEKAEKRGSTPYFMLIVGAFYLILAIICTAVWSAQV